MANISVVVQDANNVQLNLTPAPATTLIAEGGNNVTLELIPTPTQVIALDRGVAGNGIASVSVIDISGSQYLHIVFTNGSISDVGPIATSTYFGVSPIVVTGDQISLSTVPLTLGGTGATTESGARTNLGLGTIATQNANTVAITGGTESGVTHSGDTIGTHLDYTSVSSPSYAEGRTWYDSTAKALAYYNDVSGVQVHIGHDLQFKVINNTGSTIPNGSPVYITGTSSGQTYPNVALARADVAATATVIGLTDGSIANGAAGYVTSIGNIDNVNTGTYTVGQVLYLSPYSAGQLMNTIPPTGITVQVGMVTFVNSSTGKIYVKQTTPLNVPTSILSGTVAIANGGTGASTDSAARTNLGLGSAAVLTAGSALGVATLDAGGTVPLSQIPASIQGGVSYQGAWNASTNSPTLTSSVGSKGYYYVVSTAGSTNLNGVTDWNIGDWAIFNGTVWQKIDNTDAVTSVNGYTGTVSLAYADLAGAIPTWNQNTTGTAANITATSNITLTTLSSLSLPYSQLSGTVPTWNQNTTGTASNVTGTVAIANGGTGATTRQDAIDALAGSVTSGSYLRGNGTNVVMSAIQAADVPTLNQNTTGSAATLTTGRTIAITGDLAYTSGSFDGSGNVTGVGTLAASGVTAGSYTTANITVDAKGRVTAASNGTGGVTSVTGTAPVISSGGATPAISMAAASSGVNGYMTGTYATKLDGIAAGATANTGTVTSITAGTGLSGGAITTSGTIALANTAVTAGSYSAANITVDAQGRLTAASNGTGAVIGTNTQVAYNNAGTMAGSANLTFNGTNLTCGGTVTANSDESLKTNWRGYSDDFVEQLAKIKHGTYDRLDVELTQDGVSAQSLQSLLPNSVLSNEDGILSVAYGNAAMVSVIKLAERLLAAESRIEQLEQLLKAK